MRNRLEERGSELRWHGRGQFELTAFGDTAMRLDDGADLVSPGSSSFNTKKRRDRESGTEKDKDVIRAGGQEGEWSALMRRVIRESLLLHGRRGGYNSSSGYKSIKQEAGDGGGSGFLARNMESKDARAWLLSSSEAHVAFPAPARATVRLQVDLKEEFGANAKRKARIQRDYFVHFSRRKFNKFLLHERARIMEHLQREGEPGRFSFAGMCYADRESNKPVYSRPAVLERLLFGNSTIQEGGLGIEDRYDPNAFHLHYTPIISSISIGRTCRRLKERYIAKIDVRKLLHLLATSENESLASATKLAICTVLLKVVLGMLSSQVPRQSVRDASTSPSAPAQSNGFSPLLRSPSRTLESGGASSPHGPSWPSSVRSSAKSATGPASAESERNNTTRSTRIGLSRSARAPSALEENRDDVDPATVRGPGRGALLEEERVLERKGGDLKRKSSVRFALPGDPGEEEKGDDHESILAQTHMGTNEGLFSDRRVYDCSQELRLFPQFIQDDTLEQSCFKEVVKIVDCPQPNESPATAVSYQIAITFRDQGDSLPENSKLIHRFWQNDTGKDQKEQTPKSAIDPDCLRLMRLLSTLDQAGDVVEKDVAEENTAEDGAAVGGDGTSADKVHDPNVLHQYNLALLHYGELDARWNQRLLHELCDYTRLRKARELQEKRIAEAKAHANVPTNDMMKVTRSKKIAVRVLDAGEKERETEHSSNDQVAEFSATVAAEAPAAPVSEIPLVDIKVVPVDARYASFDPMVKPPFDCVVNRVSDAQNSDLQKFVHNFLTYCELWQVPVVNGSHALATAWSKTVQHAKIHRLGFRSPETRQLRSSNLHLAILQRVERLHAGEASTLMEHHVVLGTDTTLRVSEVCASGRGSTKIKTNTEQETGGFLLEEEENTEKAVGRLYPLDERSCVEHFVDAAAEQASAVGGFPVLLKPNAGGFGRGITLFRDGLELRKYAEDWFLIRGIEQHQEKTSRKLEAPSLRERVLEKNEAMQALYDDFFSQHSTDGTLLVQKYVRDAQNFVRIWHCDRGRTILGAASVRNTKLPKSGDEKLAEDVFNTCVCQRTAEGAGKGKGTIELRPYPVSDALREQVREIANSCHQDMGSIEFFEKNREFFFFDVNFLTTLPSPKDVLAVTTTDNESVEAVEAGQKADIVNADHSDPQGGESSSSMDPRVRVVEAKPPESEAAATDSVGLHINRSNGLGQKEEDLGAPLEAQLADYIVARMRHDGRRVSSKYC
ncbi:unnamed protein product [Amoebophrya sp. A25]|nr:unnamed protein product [Amoebophrya sp. A25]|eukprot:GSA25T00001786001.1